MMRQLSIAFMLLALLVVYVQAQDEAPQDLAMMEVGATSTINMAADRPLQEVAQLLVEAHKNIAALGQSRQPFQLLSNHIKVKRNTQLNLAKKKKKAAKKPGKINAQLVSALQQPTIHDSQRFGTKYPIRQGRDFVSAEIVGEDGKPYAPRKQWKGISVDNPVFRSPFAKFIHPPKVGSSADVVNKDPNTKLTKVELKTVVSLQARLKRVLDKLGANIVWDHTKIANRRLIAQFDALKTEARALMEEYELRTGVKTIAWQLADADINGLTTPRGGVTDIYFAKSPELAGRLLQRKNSRRAPLPLSDEELKALQEEHGVDSTGKGKLPDKKEAVVNVAWKKGEDGVVKAKVNLEVVKSKVPDVLTPPNLKSRPEVAGKVYPSGRVGSPSKAVQIDVVAPTGAELKRQFGMAAGAAPTINF